MVVTVVCDEYTDHGHCRWWRADTIVNDLTLICRTALSRVEAGADIGAFRMMDAVGAIRETLDARDM